MRSTSLRLMVSVGRSPMGPEPPADWSGIYVALRGVCVVSHTGLGVGLQPTEEVDLDAPDQACIVTTSAPSESQRQAAVAEDRGCAGRLPPRPSEGPLERGGMQPVTRGDQCAIREPGITGPLARAAQRPSLISSNVSMGLRKLAT